MTISSDFGKAFTSLRGVFSGAAESITYKHDSGTVAAFDAIRQAEEAVPRDVDAPDAPTVDDNATWVFRVASLAGVTTHEGRDRITAGSEVWRVIRLFQRKGSGIVRAQCERYKTHDEP